MIGINASFCVGSILGSYGSNICHDGLVMYLFVELKP